jgi:hypothetical protein
VMACATGHVKLAKRKRGDQWYVKYRQPDGRQVEPKLGPAWTGNGRPAAGYYTRRTAEEALQHLRHKHRREDAQKLADAFVSPGHLSERLRKVDRARRRPTRRDWPGAL